jgi:hypothetical protein
MFPIAGFLMKILFSMRHLGWVRNFEGVLCRLSQRGHEIHVVSEGGTAGDRDFVRQLTHRYRSLTFVEGRRESSVWREVAQWMRAGLDYLHYLHPIYCQAPRLRRRVEARAPAFFLRLSRLPVLRSPLGLRVLTATLSAAERAIPSNPGVARLIARTQPDVLVVTPLFWFASPQVDYVRSAKALGIRTMLCVGGWDNLSTKGSIYEMPDLVTVWNQTQKDEAIALHGVPPERVAVTGAHIYDHWFEWRASSREEFCDRVGLAADKPFLLYVCSSRFVAPDEATFVRTWIDQVRAANHPRLRDASILIRPHPENVQWWGAVTLSRLDNVVVWPREGTTPSTRAAKVDYYDSLYHSAAVIGLNTSAFLEAAIVGRPVYTMLAPEFTEVQEGTLHFRHLVEANGGVLQVSGDVATHLEQLASACSEPRQRTARDETFVEAFVRPHGCDVSSTPRVVEAIERVGRDTTKCAVRTPLWVYAWRAALFPLAVRGALAFVIAKERAKGKNVARLRAFRRLLLHPKAGLMRVLRLRAVAAWLRDAAVRTRPKKASHQSRSVSAESQARQLTKQALARLTDGSKPILVGPWLGEIGFEVLYWIPFLRWMQESSGIDPSRLIAVSRGGTAAWYQNVCGRYQEVFDYFSPDECYERNLKQAGLHQKQEGVGEFDRDIVKRVERSLGIGECEMLHPSLMYELFFPFWRNQASIRLVEMLSTYRLFPPVEIPDVDGWLPEDYVAVKLYANDSFPNVGENRKIAQQIVDRLTEQGNVLLLDTGLHLDEHRPFPIADRKGLMRIDRLVTPRNNLAVQTQIISRARACVGTFGGFSFLSAFCGVDSVAVYSHPTQFRAHHLDVAWRVFSTLEGGAFVPLDTAHIGLLRNVLGLEPQQRPVATGLVRSSV